MSKFDKTIMAVDRAYIFGECNEDYFTGFRPVGKVDYQKRILDNSRFIRRGALEEDSLFKQPIPY